MVAYRRDPEALVDVTYAGADDPDHLRDRITVRELVKQQADGFEPERGLGYRGAECARRYRRYLHELLRKG